MFSKLKQRLWLSPKCFWLWKYPCKPRCFFAYNFFLLQYAKIKRNLHKIIAICGKINQSLLTSSSSDRRQWSRETALCQDQMRVVGSIPPWTNQASNSLLEQLYNALIRNSLENQHLKVWLTAILSGLYTKTKIL